MRTKRHFGKVYATALCAVAALTAMSLAVAQTARASDWRYVETSPAEPLFPLFYGNGRDDTLWIVSSDGVRHSDGGRMRVVRRSAAGLQLPQDAVSSIWPLADGNLLLDVSGIRDDVGGFCAAERIALDGRATWRAELPLGDEACRGYVANDAGQGWFFAAEKLYPVDRDGRIGAQPANAGQPWQTRPAAVLPDGSVVAATRLRGDTGSRLARFDTQGAERWRWVHEKQLPLGFVTIAGDGIVAATMGIIVGRGKSVSRWNLDGQRLWTHEPPPQTEITEIIPADGGDVYVVLSDGFAHAAHVQRIGLDGGLRWQATPNCHTTTASVKVARTSDDGLALACDFGFENPTTLTRLNRDGIMAPPLLLPIDTAAQVLPRRDGRLLVFGQHTPPRPAPRVPRTLRIDDTQIVVDESLRDAAPASLIGQQILADGSTVIATAPDLPRSNDGSFVLTRLGAAGNVIWRQRVVQRAYRGGGAIAIGAGLVCVALEKESDFSSGGAANGIVCVDAGSGEARWQTMLPADDAYFSAFAIGSDASVRLVRSRANSHELFRLDRNGVVVHVAQGSGRVLSAAFSTGGRTVVVTSEALRYYMPDGTPGIVVPMIGTEIWLYAAGDGLLLADDGSTWIAGPPSTLGTSGQRISALAPDGRTRWTRDLQPPHVNALRLQGDSLYAIGTRVDSRGNDRSVEVVLERMNAATGALIWTRTERHWPFTASGSALAVSPDARELVVAHGEIARMHIERYDAADGTRLGEAYLTCNGLCGIPAAIALDTAGTTRIASDALDRDHGQTAAVASIDLARPPIRLDQPGIAGAWWSPYANGEGIAFDWLPASRTLFGAWFTYSTTGGNEASELRWYTLQANGVSNGARELSLPILETTGGNFAAGPTVSPRPVGNAKLIFSDCNNATLEYRFDTGHNDARAGTITLSRLSPNTQPCVLADGSTAPPASATPPSQGFDAKLAGTWFDAATAGQGLQFTVQPGGIFFAPWFTFDPAAAGDDAGRQHWFTLQGNLAEARNGIAELVLVQTIGGRFDRVPTYNANAIGAATLRVQGCDRAELDYRFDDAHSAGAFRAQHGTLQLTRAGGCVP